MGVMRRWFLAAGLGVVLATVFLFTPDTTMAAGLVPQCGGIANPCQFCHLVLLINNVVDWLVLILAMVAALIFMMAGFKLLTSGGNPEARSWAKQRFYDVAIGFLVLLAAWLLIDTLLKALVTGQIYGTWNQIQCVAQPDLQGGLSPTNASSSNLIDPTRLASGACSPDALRGTWGAAAETMSCIIRGESACMPGALSSTDRLRASGDSFSVGLYQVNLTVHNLNQPACTRLNGGRNLDCTSAFRGRNYDAVILNRDLYVQCVRAAQNIDCNTAVAQDLLRTRQGFNHWGAYTNPRNGCR